MKQRSGLAIVELLVAMAIVGILATLTLLAVLSSRETQRRMQCSSNLRQLSHSLQDYHNARRCLPPGLIWAPEGEPNGKGIAPPGIIDHVSAGLLKGKEKDRVFANWVILLLPYIEEQGLSQLVDQTKPDSATIFL